MASTEKVFRHRVLPIGVGFYGCQDCKKTGNDLLSLVGQPCLDEVAKADPEVYQTPREAVRTNDIGSPLVPVALEDEMAKLSLNDQGESSKAESLEPTEDQTALENELALLREQEQLLEEMAILESLKDEDHRLFEAERSLLNSTIPASSKAAPCPAGA